jgi:hypothetical protein
LVAKYISKLTNAQLDVYYSQHSAAIPLPHSGIKNKNYKVLLQNTEANQIEQPDDASLPKVADEPNRPS